MNATLIYCNNKFKKALEANQKTKIIYKAFAALEIEIKKLDFMAQVNLYTAATQLLESLFQNPNDLIVFILRCEFILGKNPENIRIQHLVLGVLAISLLVVFVSAAVGVGIGMLLARWQSPLLFLTSLLAEETAPLIVAFTSIAAGIVATVVSQFLFFKEPKVKKALVTCVEAVKQNNLSEMRLGFKAPQFITIHREEIQRRIQQEKQCKINEVPM